LILLLGGARSGKSTIAGAIAVRIGAPIWFLATARADDEEMESRIAAHRKDRPDGWTVLEAPVEVGQALGSAPEHVTVIIDCLTLWISNLMVDHTDPTILEMVEDVIALTVKRSAQTIVVSNEVGSGVVPMNPVGRRFRDLQGRANQQFAGAADSAYMVIAGKALRLEDAIDVI
jgi:adenosylcobinamide kinase / adenosylcobinamide-phosphate guanylyltransferase